MKSFVLWVGAGLIVGIGLGYVFVTHTPQQTDHHMHAMLEVSEESPIPAVSITAEEDIKDGYNVHIVTENFIFAPEHVNDEPIEGEGRAHVFVNGEKVARVYGEWFHLGATHFKRGENEIRVTLNANDHSEWIVDGERLEDRLTVMYDR